MWPPDKLRELWKMALIAPRPWSVSTGTISRSGSGWSSRTMTRPRPTADLASADGKSALGFIQYLLSAKGQAVLAALGMTRSVS